MSEMLAERAQDFLACLLEGDPHGAEAILGSARSDRVPPAAIYTRLIGPALTEVGRLWELAELSVADEHMATEITTLAVARQLTPPPPRVATQRAVVLCAPGEAHVLGARAWSSMLAERGWDVAFLGAGTPTEAVELLVAARRPQMVAYSAKLPGHLHDVADAIARLKAGADAPAILVGGAAVTALTADIGADFVVDDLSAALDWTDRTFPAPAAAPPTAGSAPR